MQLQTTESRENTKKVRSNNLIMIAGIIFMLAGAAYVIVRA